VALILGEALLGQGRLGEVERVLDERAARDPDDLDCAILRGRLRFRQGKTEEATALLLAALAIKDHPEAHLGLGVLALSTGRLHEAEDHLRAAIALEPIDPRPWRALLYRDRMAGEVARGIERAEASAKERDLVWSDLRLLLELAELYAAAGSTERLRSLLGSIQRIAQVGPGQAVELARLWSEVGEIAAVEGLVAVGGPQVAGLRRDLPAARAAWAEAARLPGVWLPHERLGAIALSTEGPAAAQPHLDEARRRAPGAADVLLLGAAVAAAKGERQGRDRLAAAAEHPGLRASLRARARRWSAAFG
jgi:tetratricopeptide (TPR) repeat protein